MLLVPNPYLANVSCWTARRCYGQERGPSTPDAFETAIRQLLWGICQLCVQSRFYSELCGNGDGRIYMTRVVSGVVLKKRAISSFQWKKGEAIQWIRGFGKDSYRKGNSVKRFGRFSEPPDSGKWKVAVLIPFPKISSALWIRSGFRAFARVAGRTGKLGCSGPLRSCILALSWGLDAIFL